MTINIVMNDLVPSDDEYKQPISHARLKKMVQSFVDANSKNSREAQTDRDYYDGRQISAKIMDELQKRGQPPVWTNKVQGAIQGLCGILDSGANDPEAMPRNASSQDAADVVTKTLRYVADKANYKRTHEYTSKNYLVEGVCAAIIDWDGKNIGLKPIRWNEFIFDPFSQDLDFSDARYRGIGKMMDADEIEAMFPDTFSAGDVAPAGEIDSIFDDDSKRSWWSDPLRKRCRVVDLYYSAPDGEWHRAMFHAGGMLYAGLSDFRDDLGQSVCPIHATTYEITRQGDRYGPIRNMRPLQDEVNARRSRLLHLVNHRQTQQTDQYANPADKKIAKTEAAKADGVLPFGFTTIQAPDLAQGQMLIFQQSTADLDRMCPTPAVLGRVASSNESGRARQVLQQAGYTELARAFGRFNAFELTLYRHLWFAARQFLTTPEIIRITDDPRAPQFLTINEPVQGMVPTSVQHPLTGEIVSVMQPGVVGMNNRLAELDMDIVLTTVPDTATLQQEVFSTLLEYASSNRLSPFQPEFWAMLEMSTLPDKRAAIEKLQRLAAEAQQQDAPAQEAAMQMQQQKQGVEMQAEQAKTAKHLAEAQKTSVETQLMHLNPAIYHPYGGQIQ